MSAQLHESDRATGFGAAVGFMTRPRAVAWTGIALLVTVGWIWLAAMVADLAPRLDMAEAGPGMAAFNLFRDADGIGQLGLDLLRSICRVDSGLTAGGLGLTGAALVLAMWVAMALAMMVPTAVPMITTYTEIAETAHAKRIPVVSPLVLIAGYLSVWLVFCVAAAALQVALARMALLTPGLVAASPWLGAGVLAVAGLYQLSAFKAACLAKCRTPMPFFLANWSDRAFGVFRMGLKQGVVCLLCCWALMLVMFAAGLMNVVWMAVLTVIMLAEKVGPRPDLVTRVTGAVLLVWAAGLAAGAVV
jgi:predicted metal-binding membrane protein